MDFIDELILGVVDYVNDAEIDTYGDIAISKRASEIILSERDFDFSYKGSRKMDFSKSLKLVREFLGKLNPSYLEYYDKRVSDGSFEYSYNDMENNPYSNYDYKNDKRVIFIPISNTVDDGFSIVHELFHDMNMVIDINKLGLGRYFTTEALSFLGELLYADFLNDKGLYDINVNNNSLCYMRRKALVLNFKLNVISEYLKNGFLNKKIVLDVLNSYKADEVDIIVENIYEDDDVVDDVNDEEFDELDDDFFINDKNDFCIETEESYVFSCLIAAYMYDRIKSNKKNINELFDLNDIVGNLDLFQVLDYLEIEHNNSELTDESYELLHKDYKKLIKRW